MTLDFDPDRPRMFTDRVSASWDRGKIAIELRIEVQEQIRMEEPTY
jgi:hypothetical protein